MIAIRYAPTFVRMYKKLNSRLKEEVKEKISLFQKKENHQKLKVHKFNGALDDTYSFSVNFKTRIVFEYESNTIANLLYIGSHDEAYD